MQFSLLHTICPSLFLAYVFKGTGGGEIYQIQNREKFRPFFALNTNEAFHSFRLRFYAFFLNSQTHINKYWNVDILFFWLAFPSSGCKIYETTLLKFLRRVSFISWVELVASQLMVKMRTELKLWEENSINSVKAIAT